jgi:uncharacterized membrane protein YozB (DUF420 family)
VKSRKGVRGMLGVVIGLLALLGVGAAATHYLYEPYNPGFLEYPTIVALHVVLGGLYLALAPLQFVRRILSRHLGYHRWAGRVLVSIGLVIGATGMFMGLVIPIAGWIERGYISAFGVLFLVALVKGFVHIRAKRVALHREWMIRAFAIGLAVVTQRLIFIPALLVVADPTQGPVATLSAVSFLAAFVLHSSLAEVWIRLTRRSGFPVTRAAKAA